MTDNETQQVSRLILCDPVCVLPYGHNVAAMLNFSAIVGQYFNQVLRVACSYLPENVQASNSFTRHFDFYYSSDIKVELSDKNVCLPSTHEEKVTAAKKDLISLLDKLQVSSADTLCYPSIDFYSLYALSESVAELEAKGSPSLLIRLIGVMETAASGEYETPMNVVLAMLARLLQSGLSIKIAAETPRYADFLAAHLDCGIAVTANIESRPQLPLPDDGTFTVICPGSARYDKGFLELGEIFRHVRRADPDLRIRFKTQVLPDRELKHHLHYLQSLHAIPGVTVLPAQVSAEVLEEMFAKADLVLLPYAADVYEFRGSAVMVEAICSGRQVVARAGPAFVEQLLYFGAGAVCRTNEEMAARIIALSKEAPSLRFAKARQTRQRFTEATLDSYRHWAA